MSTIKHEDLSTELALVVGYLRERAHRSLPAVSLALKSAADAIENNEHHDARFVTWTQRMTAGT